MQEALRLCGRVTGYACVLVVMRLNFYIYGAIGLYAAFSIDMRLILNLYGAITIYAAQLGILSYARGVALILLSWGRLWLRRLVDCFIICLFIHMVWRDRVVQCACR